MSSFETAVMPAFLLFWVSFPFGFQLVLHQFSLGTSCPFGPGAFTVNGIYLGVSFVKAWGLLLSGLLAAITTILLELDPFFMLPDSDYEAIGGPSRRRNSRSDHPAHESLLANPGHRLEARLPGSALPAAKERLQVLQAHSAMHFSRLRPGQEMGGLQGRLPAARPGTPR